MSPASAFLVGVLVGLLLAFAILVACGAYLAWVEARRRKAINAKIDAAIARTHAFLDRSRLN